MKKQIITQSKRKEGFRLYKERELDLTEELVKEVIDRRLELNLSQRELAKLSGINQSAIARFENLGSIPRIDTLNRIIKPLGMRVGLVKR